MRLIDVDKMLKRIETWNTSDAMDKALYNFTLNRIIEQPTVDAVPVIRCKDCKYYADECCDRYADETIGYVHSTQQYGYCWVAERKEE